MNLVTNLDFTFERVNLIPINAAICLIGAGIIIAIMQLSTIHGDMIGESRFGIWSRRFSYFMLVAALMWSCSYSDTKGWQPWPPHVFLVFVLDVVLALRLVQIAQRCYQLRKLFVDRDARRASARR